MTLQDGGGALFGNLGSFLIDQQGSDIYLTYTALGTAAIPEPSSALILLGGLATLLMGRRRRQLAGGKE